MITLTINNKNIQCKSGTTGNEIAGYFTGDPAKLMAIKVNNELVSLKRPLRYNGKIEPVYSNSIEGAQVYRQTLCFILAAAAHKLFPEDRLVIGHSLGSGYYYNFVDKKISSEELKMLQKEMQSIVEANYPIENTILSYEEACRFFEEANLPDTRKQLEFKCPPSVFLNTLNGYSDLYFGACAETTGQIKVFELKEWAEGFILRFPAEKNPDVLPDFINNEKIYSVFRNYIKWGHIQGINTASDINEKIINRQINDVIDLTETFQAENFNRVAKMIYDRKNVKVVLIAGPSSSGKTTSAKKMAMHLRTYGYTPKVISLDSYYVGRAQNPKDENGNYDYECLEALDIELLNQNLNDLFEGKEIDVPQYNFDLGERFYNGEKMKLAKTDILIMEGIHGLNDRLTPKIRNEYKFKIYLSALTPLNLNDHNRIPTSDNRLIRRIVRDSKFRGKSAAATIGMWESVQKGERLHIFPFQNNADAVINTALDYELPVLKVYASPLLRAVKPSDPEYSEACRLLRFLDNFDQIPADYVPKQSIVREFIGGSSFKY